MRHINEYRNISLLTGVGLVTVLLMLIGGRVNSSPRPIVVPSAAFRPSDNFALPDLQGHIRQLRDFRGGTVVLFFFCGCSFCHDTAIQWSRLQRLSEGGGLDWIRGVRTVIVYSGGSAEAQQFEIDTNLDQKSTTIFLDPEDRVTDGLYHALPCPRGFVLDSTQRVLFTNKGMGVSISADPVSPLIAGIVGTLSTQPRAAQGTSRLKGQTSIL